MSFPLQTATVDQVLAAQIRGCLNAGADYSATSTLQGTTATGAPTASTTVSLTALTDNSGGTASNTIAAISDTATKNAVASLTVKVNLLLNLIRNLNA
jgi:hypothetical protein